MACSAPEQGSAFVLVGAVEKEVERRLEPVRDLMFVRLQRKIGGDHSYHGSNNEARHGPILFNLTDDIDRLGIEQDFFPGFTLSSCDGVLARVQSAARKSDLSGMCPQMFTADRQDHSRNGSLGDGNQNGRGNVSLRALLQQVTFERRQSSGRCKRFAEAIG